MAWGPAAQSIPGLLIVGGDGSREMLAVNTSDPHTPATLIDITSSNWADSIPQMPVEQFIAHAEAGTSEFTRE